MMTFDFITFLDKLGEANTVALGGLVIGILFGVSAQRSRFCLRSAVITFARGTYDTRLPVWLLTFSAALTATQALVLLDVLIVDESRHLASRGSLSGALIGGAMFGTGMILARGCASRLLVLSANGNLRALLSGLVFAVTAQAAFRGVLAPARDWLAGLWTVEGGAARDLLAIFSVGNDAGAAFGAVWIAAAIFFGLRARVPLWGWVGGTGCGLAVAAGWYFTYQMSTLAFEGAPVESITFTGPSADMLMLVLSPPGVALDFDVGLVPGVFLGSFFAALIAQELKLEGFEGGPAMRRYMSGAALMGFGGMLAGGCAVGAGVTGGSVFALTAWAALSAMWASAAFTDWLVDRRREPRGSARPAAEVPATPPATS